MDQPYKAQQAFQAHLAYELSSNRAQAMLRRPNPIFGLISLGLS
jgi:hypothetical protein